MKKNISDNIVGFIRKCVHSAGMKSAVVGISGGLDSAVVTALTSKALGYKNVHGMLLPYGEQEDIIDSYSVIKKYKVPFERMDIRPMVDSFRGFEKDKDMDSIRYGNIMARVRMIWLYDRSKKFNSLVVGTGNRSELLMGYFTLHGDRACDLEPIAHLYKTEVKELARELKVPESIINKTPSAGLWKGQTDEEEIGITYEDMDKTFIRTEKMSFKMNLPKIIVRDDN